LLKKYFYNSEEVFPTISHQIGHNNQSMPSTIGNIVKTMLANFITLATTLIAVFPLIFTSLILNATPAEKLSTYPYYHFVQFHLHICPFLGTGLLVISYYFSNANLRSVAFRNLKDLLQNGSS